MLRKPIAIITFVMCLPIINFQSFAGGDGVFGNVDYSTELQADFSCGEHNPLWLNANRYGLSSIENNSGYLRGGVFRSVDCDSIRRCGVGYGADLVVPINYTSKFIVQQAYFEGKWLKGRLTIGSKQQPMNLKNQELSSGSQTLGINARPSPEIRIALNDYWNIPGMKNWLAFRGHLAYGIQTDDCWQTDFTAKKSRYTEHTLYHSKSGFLKIGSDNKPLQFEFGLEMGCQFGGTAYRFDNDGNKTKYLNDQGIAAFWHALVPNSGGAGDIGEGIYANTEGNHMGSWLARLTYKGRNWKISAYMDHYFEDHSQMLFTDYDGYGTGAEWDVKKSNRFLLYKFKDCMWGLEATMPENPFVSSIVAEYVYTKDQGGPIYHDHTSSMPDHVAGKDNYYNHYIFVGWQHWGQVIGNPLYLSPIYNGDGLIMVENNRFWAWHFGISGNPTANIHYRLLSTWQKGWGTYDFPYRNPKKNFSFLAETTFNCSKLLKSKGWSVKGAFAIDKGSLLGDNTGFQLTIAKAGRL